MHIVRREPEKSFKKIIRWTRNRSPFVGCSAISHHQHSSFGKNFGQKRQKEVCGLGFALFRTRTRTHTWAAQRIPRAGEKLLLLVVRVRTQKEKNVAVRRAHRPRFSNFSAQFFLGLGQATPSVHSGPPELTDYVRRSIHQ